MSMPDLPHRRTLDTGFRLNRFQIEALLGQGRCGATYAALDLESKTRVVVKEYFPVDVSERLDGALIQPVPGRAEEIYHIGMEAFLSEARLLAPLEHPNIVRILDVFLANNTAYVVMERVAGKNLEIVLKERGTLTEEELRNFESNLLGALSKLHQRMHIHGDIKPENILVTADGNPVLLDFGSARWHVAEQIKNVSPFASPYSAPEQYTGSFDRLGPSTDIYGVAATLYRCITGSPPASALERSRLAARGLVDPLLPFVTEYANRYSEAFLAAVDSALAIRPTDRPQSIVAWKQDFIPPKPAPATAETEALNESISPAPKFGFAPWQWGLAGVAVIGSLMWMGWHRAPPESTVPPSVANAPAVLPKAPPAPPTPPPASAGISATPITPPAPPKESTDRMLAQAREDFQAGRLAEPVGQNALEKYRAVLAREPGHGAARQGIQDIAERFVQLSELAMDQKNWSQAQQLLDQALIAAPDSGRVMGAQEVLKKHLAEASVATAGDQNEPTMEQLAAKVEKQVAQASRLIKQGQWKKAQTALDLLEKTPVQPDQLGQLRSELTRTKAEADAKKRVENAQPKPSAEEMRLLRQAIRAMKKRDWIAAQQLLDQVALLAPASEQLAQLRLDLASRVAQSEPSVAPGATANGATDASPAVANQRATDLKPGALGVKIRRAAASQSFVAPGTTIEFVTEYQLSLPESRPDQFVTATWTMSRNGVRIGGEGAASDLETAGDHAKSTTLTVTDAFKPGSYVVKHRIRAGKASATATSTFTVGAAAGR